MNRKGLTLIEMLVALALTIFMMAILSEAFVTGLKAFRRLKAVGDMDEQLRTAAIILRRDLQSEHFDGYRRLSSYQLGTQLNTGAYDRPNQGFFTFHEGINALGQTATREDTTPDNVSRPTYYDNDGDTLHFTTRLPGNKPETFFYGSVPSRARLALGNPQPLDAVGRYSSRFDDSAQDARYPSQWAEIAYYLQRDGTRVTYDETTGQGLPIYKLYRTQLLLVPEVFTVNAVGSTTTAAFESPETYAAYSNAGTPTVIVDNVKWLNYFAGQVGTNNQYTHDVSAYAEPQGGNFRYRYNSPADVQFRERRFGELGGNYVRLGAVSPNSVIREGADLLAVNVVSWDIKVFDPFAIRGTAINAMTNPQVRYLPEFVDLGHNQNGQVNLPMPTTDGVYNYTWNDYWVDPMNPPPNYWRDPLFKNAGNNATLPRTFDSWTNRDNGTWNYLDGSALRNLPYAGPVQALQITIRLWDEVTKQTRQISIVVDM